MTPHLIGTDIDAATDRLIGSDPDRSSQQKLHPRTPILLVVSFFAGLTAAFAQHGLYSFLHNRFDNSEHSKTGLVLAGRALAYLAKIAFARCIILCYNQRIWRTFQNHRLSIRSIDQLFSGIEDVSLLTNMEALMKAPLVSFMAMVVWMIPLATVIASPSALSFGWRPEYDDAFVSVPTLNLSVESYKDWRKPVPNPQGGYKRSLFYYNTTDMRGEKEGWFDYYDQPSREARRLFSQYLFSYSARVLLNSTFSTERSRKTACGGDWNCTYTISFEAPGYKCEDIYITSNGLLNTSLLVPEGNLVYAADVDTGEYKNPQFEDVIPGPGGVPVGEPPHEAEFRMEPEIWLGYAVNSTEWLAKDSAFANNWTHRYDRYVVRCIHHETKYTAHFDFTGQRFLFSSSSEYISPILGFNFSENNTGILPQDRWISPRKDPVAFKKIATYHALGELFRDLLRGNLELKPPLPGPSYLVPNSEITKSQLVQINSQPGENLGERVQSFYHDMILTLLTNSELLVNSEEKVLVHRSRHRVAFIYDPVRLWACYAPVILLTFIILLIGAYTIYQDGTTFSAGFSRILATTRNPTLDGISRGVSLGNDPFPEELMRTKLQFGMLGNGGALKGEGESTGHCTFGLPGEVGRISRQKKVEGD